MSHLIFDAADLESREKTGKRIVSFSLLLVLAGLINTLTIFKVYLKFLNQYLMLGIGGTFGHSYTDEVVADR